MPLFCPLRILSVTALVAAMCAPLACGPLGGTPDAGTHDGAGMSSDDLKQAFIDAYASYLEACFLLEDPSAFLEELEPDGDGRPAPLEQRRYALWLLTYVLDLEGVSLDEAAARECIAALEANTATCSREYPAACGAVFQGSLADGSSCVHGYQCASGACNSGDDNARCGSCGPVPPEAGPGESCDFRVCAEGLYCAAESTGLVCRPLGEEGDECFDEATLETRQCADGLYCSFTTGSCAPRIGIGGACEGFDWDECAADLECATWLDLPTCQPILVGDTVGAPCNPNGEGCGDVIFTGLVCVGEPGSASCVEASVVEPGETCDAQPYTGTLNGARFCKDALSAYACVIPEGATEGTCEARPDVGEPCDPYGTACNPVTSYCSSTDGESYACEALPGEGDPCVYGSYCPNGLTCDQWLDQPTCVALDDVSSPQCMAE